MILGLAAAALLLDDTSPFKPLPLVCSSYEKLTASIVERPGIVAHPPGLAGFIRYSHPDLAFDYFVTQDGSPGHPGVVALGTQTVGDKAAFVVTHCAFGDPKSAAALEGFFSRLVTTAIKITESPEAPPNRESDK